MTAGVRNDSSPRSGRTPAARLDLGRSTGPRSCPTRTSGPFTEPSRPLRADGVPARGQLRRAGTPLRGDRERVGAPAAHLAFRVVQENLANALRYAPGSDVRIAISVEPGRRGLAVQVENSPTDRAGGRPPHGTSAHLAGQARLARPDAEAFDDQEAAMPVQDPTGARPPAQAPTVRHDPAADVVADSSSEQGRWRSRARACTAEGGAPCAC